MPSATIEKPTTAEQCARTASVIRDAAATADDLTSPNGSKYDLRFVASTELLATDGGVIPTAAWNLNRFAKRPRFLAQHDMWGDPEQTVLGRVVDIRVETGLDPQQVGPSGRALVAYVRFMSTPAAQNVLTLYREGGMDDVSVRWDPRTMNLRDPNDAERAQFGEDIRWVAQRTDLMEISAVVYGADNGWLQGPGGAQVLRAQLGDLPRIELARLVAGAEGGERGEILRVLRAVDSAAVGDAVENLGKAMTAFDAWTASGQPIRQQIGDGLTVLKNLIAEGAIPGSGEETDEDDDASPGSSPGQDDAVSAGDAGSAVGGGAHADDTTKSSDTNARLDAMEATLAKLVDSVAALAKRSESAATPVPAGEAGGEAGGESGGARADEDKDALVFDLDALRAAHA